MSIIYPMSRSCLQLSCRRGAPGRARRPRARRPRGALPGLARRAVPACAALAFAALASVVPASAPAQPTPASIEGAYRFLGAMMDRYASGAQLRLVQSYSGGTLEREGVDDSFTYDDAVIIDALLARSEPENLARAQVLGRSLLYVQEHDPAADGRIRAAYAPTPLASPADVTATDPISDVGNMAWVGQALVHLYERTGTTSFLAGARELAGWIVGEAHDERGAGGYTGGEEAGGGHIRWKSTEHNIDLYSFFSLLAAATGEAAWTQDAAHARRFVEAMWEPHKGMFWVGTGDEGVKPNRHVRAEDVNSWSYLALRDAAFGASLDWVTRYLAVNKKGFSGVSFCKGSRKGVWFEGTAHIAEALFARGLPGDEEAAERYLADIEHAQLDGPNNDGEGIIAASRDGVGDCEGEAYFASLHTGATAWYLLAAGRVDPFEPLEGGL